jgi:hypothetical protein
MPRSVIPMSTLVHAQHRWFEKSVMGSIYVKNGTPIGATSLCNTCTNAHIVEGYREFEAIVLCTYASYDRALFIPFKVKSCSNHYDKARPTWEQMEKLALPVDSKNTHKSVGFLTKVKVEGDSKDDESNNE